MNQVSFRKRKEEIQNLDHFKQIYDEHKKPVFAMALSILRDFELAEDVLQEVFIKLFHHMKQKDISNLQAWLVRVARNTALDMLRKKKREITGFENDYFERVHSFIEDPIEKMVLKKYLGSLDSDERQIVILKEVVGMKHREISNILKMPLGTVLWKHNRAFKKLKKELE